jgi:cell wall assembly regulator SMI1
VARLAAGAGRTLPAELVQLYGLADGLDVQRWKSDRLPGWEPVLVGGEGLMFPPVAEAAEVYRMQRDAARSLRDGGVWPEAWWPVLVVSPGEVVAVDTAAVDVDAVLVIPEAEQRRVVARGVAALLDRLVVHLELAATRWDERTGLVEDRPVEWDDFLPGVA